jgi:hypothetical protein
MARAASMLFRATSTDDKPLTALFHRMQKLQALRVPLRFGGRARSSRGRHPAKIRKSMT